MQFSTLLSALYFYIIPLITGAGIVAGFKLALKKEINTVERYGQLYNSFFYFAVGAVFLYLVKIATHPFIGNNYLFQFYIPIFITSVLYILERIKDKKGFNNTLETGRVLLFVLVMCSIVYASWRHGSPTTTSLNWDLYHHQTLANLMAKGNFSFNTSSMSDTFQFDGYSTIFHYILSLSQSLTNANPLEFWWFVEYFHLVSTVLASFLVGFAFTKRTKIALISAIFGAFIFEASGAYTSLFLIPQTLTATVGAVYVANKLLKLERGHKLFEWSDAFVIAFVLLTHIIIGILIIVSLITVLIIYKMPQRFAKVRVDILFLILAFILVIAIPFVSNLFNLNQLNRGEAAFFNISLSSKFMLMKTFYGFSLLIFLPLGIFYALRSKLLSNHIAVILALGLISLVLSPIPYALKLYSLDRFYVHTIMAMGVWILIKSFGNKLYAVGVFLLSSMLFMIVTINFIVYKQVPIYKDSYTHISPMEIDAINFTKENYAGENVMIISEPATMHIFEGISGVNTPGGAYASLETRQLLTDIYYTRDSRTILTKLWQIQDGVEKITPEKLLFVVSGRFDKWEKFDDDAKNGIYWNVWTPYDLSPENLEDVEFIDYLEKTKGLKEVFRNRSLVIFEVAHITH